MRKYLNNKLLYLRATMQYSRDDTAVVYGRDVFLIFMRENPINLYVCSDYPAKPVQNLFANLKLEHGISLSVILPKLMRIIRNLFMSQSQWPTTPLTLMYSNSIKCNSPAKCKRDHLYNTSRNSAWDLCCVILRRRFRVVTQRFN